MNLDLNDFNLINVGSDGNYGYRAIALQLYSNENFYNNIRVILINIYIKK